MRRCCLNQFEVKHKDAEAAAEEKTGTEENLVTEAWSVGNTWAELRDCGTKDQDEKTTQFFFTLYAQVFVCMFIHVN